MIALFTDFGLTNPYIGQMHIVLARQAPGIPIIDLFHAVPNFDIRAGAYLLPAYTRDLPPNSVVVAVVDPEVGSTRRPVMIEVDGRWFVGPDNGLFELVHRRATAAEVHAIQWRPSALSPSFHGRDLFAPVAAKLACGKRPDSEPVALTPPPGGPWPDDLAAVVFVDNFGNLITGLRAASVDTNREIRLAGEVVKYARVFSDVPVGGACWYENANGLIEISVNRGSAASKFDSRPGDPVTLI